MRAPRGLRTRPAGAAILLLALLVLALHLAALDWLGSAFQPLAAGRLPEPIYTQLLRPTPPSAVVQRHAAAPVPTLPAPRPAPERAPPPSTTQPAPQPMPMPVGTAIASAPAPEASASPPASAPAATHAAPSDRLSRPGAHASSPSSSALRRSATPLASSSQPVSDASAPVAEAPAWPPSTKLSYTITGYWRGDLHGSGALVWTVDGDHYDATLSGSALISFAYQSTGRIDGDWLAPDRYTERVFTREKSIQFNRASNTLRFSAIPEALPLPPHAQDSASLFLQLANRLTTRPGDFRPGATVTFTVARPSGMTDWTFTVVGMDTVATPAGPLQCWHVVRQATQSNELDAQIWLSPQLQNLPVQIRLQQSADSFLLFTLDHAAQAAPQPSASAP